MTPQETVRPYFKTLQLDESRRLVDALSLCGAVLGYWGLHGLSENKLRKFQSKESRRNAYIPFDIPKKSGGMRHIKAPEEKLKQIQQTLNLLLQTICTVSPQAMGFVPGRSVRDNADLHCGQSLIFNCDLRDFFPSITKEMVRTTLHRELASYTPSREVISMICSLATAPREDGVEALPQGAPTSPVLSNLVLKNLDRRLAGLAEKCGCRYSRYADDITFSSDCREIPTDAILAIIADEGMEINDRKTQLQTPDQRHEVTGLTVIDKVNVPRKYIKQLRTLLHLWESRGLDEAQEIFTRDLCNGEEKDLTNVINGKINYLCMIKGREDSTYRRLKQRFRILMQQLKQSKAETNS